VLLFHNTVCVSESDLRIVLLGKSLAENSRVGKLILGNEKFDSKAPSDQVQTERKMHKTVINAPHLLQTHLSDNQIIETVRKCLYLSDPGPHVIILVLQQDQCSTKDQEHVEKVLNAFSNKVYEYTMVLTTQESDSVEPAKVNGFIKEMIKKCFNRHYKLTKNSPSADLKENLEKFAQMNSGHYLICDEFEGSENSTEQQDRERGESENIL